MKAILFVAACALAAAPVQPLLAQTATPKPASTQQQIEFESKFFTISAGSARRLGLIHLPDEPAKWRGVLAAPEYEDLLRLVAAEKGVDVLSAPRVTTKVDQRAVIEIIREFRYPTEFDLSPVSSAAPKAARTFTPSTFETRNTGVTLEVEGRILPGNRISIVASPRLTEFEGFVSYAGGKTQKAQPTPATGFSQPIFDLVHLDSSVTGIGSGETILMGGFSREKSLLVTLEPARHPSARPVKNLSPAEPDLLFITLTAKATSVPVRPARKAGDLKAGSRIKIETRLWNTTEDRLPPSLRPPSDSQKDAVPPVVYSLAAVYSPAAMTELFESTSGEQFSIGPEKVIHPDGRYYVEASGPLIYPAGAVSEPANAKKKKPVKEAETLDLQLEVKAQVEEGSIDLDIVPALKVSDPPRTALQDLSDRAVGASALVWKTPELSATEAPKWRTNRVVKTSVTIYDGQTVILLSHSQGQKGRVQLLLITATGVESPITPEDSKPGGS